MQQSETQEQAIWNTFFTLLFLILVAYVSWYILRLGGVPVSIPNQHLIILVLATFRMIRLLVYDTVTEYVRGYLARFETGPRRTLFRLMTCPWCTGIWVSLLITFLYFASPIFWYFIFVLAIAGAGSFLQVTISRISR